MWNRSVSVYDSKEARDIYAALGARSLKPLDALVSARHYAGLIDGEEMHRWAIDGGALVLDSDGNTGHLEVVIRPGVELKVDMLSGFPTLLLFDDAVELLTQCGYSVNYTGGDWSYPPPLGSHCAKCGTRWDRSTIRHARPIEVRREWISDDGYIGHRYQDIPRAHMLADGLVRIKSTTFVTRQKGTVHTCETGLTYEHRLKYEEELSFGIYRYDCVGACAG